MNDTHVLLAEGNQSFATHAYENTVMTHDDGFGGHNFFAGTLRQVHNLLSNLSVAKRHRIAPSAEFQDGLAIGSQPQAWPMQWS